MEFNDLPPVSSPDFWETDYSRIIREISAFSWTIELEEFQRCQQKPDIGDQCLVSPVFPDDSNADFKWYMKLVPFEYDSFKPAFATIHLYLSEKSKIPIKISAHAWISLYTENHTFFHEIKHRFQRKDGFELENFADMSLMEFELACGPVAIHVKISVSYDVNVCHTSNFFSERVLLDNLSTLFKEKILTDVTIITRDNAKFEAHSHILTARSKVFSEMLKTQMTEGFTREIAVKDCSRSTMENLLNFIYSCKVEFKDIETTMSLLHASDKYELPDLKLQCVEYLSSIADEDNVCSLLLTAEDNNLPDLKKNILHHFGKAQRQFNESKMYQEILARKPLSEIGVNFGY